MSLFTLYGSGVLLSRVFLTTTKAFSARLLSKAFSQPV